MRIWYNFSAVEGLILMPQMTKGRLLQCVLVEKVMLA